MPSVHPTALVDATASLSDRVDIGPYSIIEAGAVIGEGTRVMASAFVGAGCEVGPDCELHQGAVVGGAPQMRVMNGPSGRVRIGRGTILREYVTVHRAMNADAWTVVGERCFLLATSHVAHDCVVGDDVTLANSALLAGFVTVGARSFVSGNTSVHQFVRVGRLAMVGGGARVPKDIPPFALVAPDGSICGLNVVGMRRAGLSSGERLVVKRVFHTLYHAGLNVRQALEVLRGRDADPLMDEIVGFVSASRRGLAGWRRRGRRGAADDATDDN